MESTLLHSIELWLRKDIVQFMPAIQDVVERLQSARWRRFVDRACQRDVKKVVDRAGSREHGA